MCEIRGAPMGTGGWMGQVLMEFVVAGISDPRHWGSRCSPLCPSWELGLIGVPLAWGLAFLKHVEFIQQHSPLTEG